MAYTLSFTKRVQKIADKWKKSNPFLYKKFVILLDEIIQHPRTGTGHPEPLVQGEDRLYSRRITGCDRMIYEIEDEIITVTVIKLEGHYGDK